MKKCNKCDTLKDESEFAFKNKSAGKLNSNCKSCHRSYCKTHYDNNTQYYKDKAIRSNASYKERNKTFVDNYKAKLGCSNCDEHEPCALDFHHIEDKFETISLLVGTSRPLKTIQKEIEKCIVLCANCHRKLHAGKLELV